MRIIKIFILIVVMFIISRVLKRYRAGDITAREFSLWLLFWFLVSLATIMPQRTDVIAQFLGVARGADLLVYLSIITLFFLVFKIMVKLEQIEKQITRLVRHLALDNNDNQPKDK